MYMMIHVYDDTCIIMMIHVYDDTCTIFLCVFPQCFFAKIMKIIIIIIIQKFKTSFL